MGAANSVEVPGGGTEGYHVLRVSKKKRENRKIQEVQKVLLNCL